MIIRCRSSHAAIQKLHVVHQGHQKMDLKALAYNESPDQPVHLCSLIRTLIHRLQKYWYLYNISTNTEGFDHIRAV